MPRFEPGTAAGDFTVMVGNMTYLDARPDQPGDNLGYAVFGRVVQGMDVVRAILAAPVSATEGRRCDAGPDAGAAGGHRAGLAGGEE